MLALTACARPGFPIYADGVREFAYVANSASNTVTVLDLVYLRPDRTLSVGNAPVALAVNSQRDEVYVVNSQPGQPSGSVSVIDTGNNAVTATIPVQRNPSFIVVDKTGQRAFVVNTGSNSVTVLDLAKRQSIATVATANRPDAAALSPDGRTLVVTNPASGSIGVYSATIPALPAAGAVLAPAPKLAPPLSLRATFNGCPGATSPVILPDSTKAFVACAGAHQVMAIWLAAAPESRFAEQDATFSSDHVLAVLDVGQNPTNMALKPDGGEIFVSNRDSNSVSEIATQTDEVESTYGIGNRPAHSVVSADNALWVSNLGGEAVSLYSIDDGKLVPPVRTGVSPDALAFGNDGNLLLAANTRSGDVAVIRTTGKLGPALFTMLPAGGSPAAIVVKSMPPGK